MLNRKRNVNTVNTEASVIIESKNLLFSWFVRLFMANLATQDTPKMNSNICRMNGDLATLTQGCQIGTTTIPNVFLTNDFGLPGKVFLTTNSSKLATLNPP